MTKFLVDADEPIARSTAQVAVGAPTNALLQGLFCPGAVAIQARPSRVDDALFPEELAYVCNAVDKRKAEFGAGRLCARRALGALGIASGPLLADANGAPVWPDGVVGSISHVATLCAAIAQRSTAARALGFDIEERRALDPEIVRMICTPRELGQLNAHRASEGATLLPIIYFSAKEAFYKCQYTLTGTLLDFQDVELVVDLAKGCFILVAEPAPIAHVRRWTGLTGRLIWTDRFACTGIQVPA